MHEKSKLQGTAKSVSCAIALLFPARPVSFSALARLDLMKSLLCSLHAAQKLHHSAGGCRAGAAARTGASKVGRAGGGVGLPPTSSFFFCTVHTLDFKMSLAKIVRVCFPSCIFT